VDKPTYSADLAAARGLTQDQARDAMRAIYLPLLKAQPRDRFTVAMDVAYGPHERNKLDVHVPKPKPTGVPVVMFVYGGGFTRGHKNDLGELVHGNVPDFFARNGYVGVNVNYRLAPDAQWPAGGEDVGAAVAWARQNIASYGGDPTRIFIMGHSSGATHVATYAFRKELHPAGGPGIRGVMCLSGNYFLNRNPADPNHLAYYGEDMTKWDARSLIDNASWDGTSFAAFISTAEHEPFSFNRSFAAMLSRLSTVGGAMPRFKLFLEHNHSSEHLAIGTGDAAIEAELLDFVRSHS
jgi:acetyl esterase